MKKIYFKSLLLLLALLSANTGLMGQVAINTDGSAPDASAMLDVNSTNKGILIPRMPLEQIVSIAPVNGLLVYSTTDNSFYFYKNTEWVKLSSEWKLSGNDLYYNSGNVVVGGTSEGSTASDGAILDIQSTEKGLLIPRMTAAEKAAISPISQGLLVYQTDGVPGFYFYQGSTWRSLTKSSYSSISSTTSLNSNHDIVLCTNSSPITITLPAVLSNAGRIYTIKNTGSSVVTIMPTGTEQIDGLAANSYALGPKNSIQVLSNGSSWYFISDKSPQYRTGNLTDGAPTASELNSVIGINASAASLRGANYLVKDNTGTSLFYLVESDGTSWYYTIMNRAQ